MTNDLDKQIYIYKFEPYGNLVFELVTCKLNELSMSFERLGLRLNPMMKNA